MTEKIESMELYPMRGHSRGEWYCSLDDIAKSEEDAEYWAIFGVTHRGNKHCLGEFPTKTAALAARQGMKPLRPETVTRSRERRIVQIEAVYDQKQPKMVDLFALCDDGSVWRRGIGIRRAAGLMDARWEQITLDGISDVQPKVRFGSKID